MTLLERAAQGIKPESIFKPHTDRVGKLGKRVVKLVTDNPAPAAALGALALLGAFTALGPYLPAIKAFFLPDSHMPWWGAWALAFGALDLISHIQS